MKKEKTDMKDENMLTKKDLNKCYIRLSLWGETSLNFERMQGNWILQCNDSGIKEIVYNKRRFIGSIKKTSPIF